MSILLNLQYPPTPEAAPKHAELCVAAVKNVDNVELDYSIESLRELDQIIEQLRADGTTSEQIGETLYAFGCYVGEVLVRNASGRWVESSHMPLAGPGGFPLVQYGEKSVWNPIGKVFKRLEEGPEHDLPYFFQVITTPSEQ